jgi:hypothetical protein
MQAFLGILYANVALNGNNLSWMTCGEHIMEIFCIIQPWAKRTFDYHVPLFCQQIIPDSSKDIDPLSATGRLTNIFTPNCASQLAVSLMSS